MTGRKAQLISAQVLLKTKHGLPPADADLTAARITQLLPPADVVESVLGELVRAGFQVGTVVGLTFSLSGPRTLFERYFHLGDADTDHGSIPTQRLPGVLQRAVASVVFPPPPEFGPSNFG